MNFLRVADGGNEILFKLRANLWIDSLDFSRILHSQQDGASMPVEKGANRLIYVSADLFPGGFELRRDSFARRMSSIIFRSLMFMRKG